MSTQHHARLRRPRIGLLVATAIAALGVAACAPPGPAAAPEGSTAPASVSTALPSTPVTLKLYDGQGLKTMDEALIAAFQKKYPQVTIEGTYDPDNVTTQNQPRQLASATPPDLIRVISVTDGTKNGLLTDLDPYAAAYGWDKLPAAQLAQFRSENDVAGSGPLYAKPSGFTMTGLYYDKKNAAALGMTKAPGSVEEVTALLGKAKDAGLVGLVTSNKTGAVVLPFQPMLNTSMGPDAVSTWVFNARGATIDTPESVQAATTLDEWNKAGYLPSDLNASDANTAMAAFTGGKGLFYSSGNWDAPNLDKTMAGNVGFVEMPPVTADGKAAAMSDASTAFGIPSKSKNKDAAAAFLSFLSSDEARQIAIDNGFMPSGTTDQAAPKVADDSVLGDVVKGFTTVSANGALVPFVQNATAGISDQAWTPESQLLIAGKSTPQQFVANVQAKYVDQLQR